MPVLSDELILRTTIPIEVALLINEDTGRTLISKELYPTMPNGVYPCFVTSKSSVASEFAGTVVDSAYFNSSVI